MRAVKSRRVKRPWERASYEEELPNALVEKGPLRPKIIEPQLEPLAGQKVSYASKCFSIKSFCVLALLLAS